MTKKKIRNDVENIERFDKSITYMYMTLYRIVNIDIKDQSIMIDCMITIVAIELKVKCNI